MAAAVYSIRLRRPYFSMMKTAMNEAKKYCGGCR
jgi:hypothetical protein